MSDQVNWCGYDLYIHEHSAQWKPLGGIYIFSGRNTAGQWVAIYVGQAEKLSDRIPGHERWDEARRHGATHVHAMVVPLKETRDRVERDLIQRCNPALNVQLKAPLWPIP